MTYSDWCEEQMELLNYVESHTDANSRGLVMSAITKILEEALKEEENFIPSEVIVYQRSVLEWTGELDNEAPKWCNEKCKARWRYQYTGYPAFFFESEDDAMRFKLVFG
jgi:hypothetical protein